MHHLRRGKPVEVGGRGMGISPDIFRIDQVTDIKFRQFCT